MFFKNRKFSVVEFAMILAALAGIFWVASTLSKPIPWGRFSAGADAPAEETILVSVNSGGGQGDGFSNESSISADGRYVAFTSHATNLVPGDSNGQDDVFVYDTKTHTTKRVSVDSHGVQANGSSFQPSISADGRYIAFVSDATNLVSGDTNASGDIFVHDMQTGTTTRVSVDSDGAQTSGADAGSGFSSISANGRYVVFNSSATNLVPDGINKGNVFVHDMQTGATTCASIDSNGVPGNNASYYASISADGRYVAFTSYATNLVPGDTNTEYDVFVHDMQTGKTTRISVNANGEQGNGRSTKPSISADGRYVVFESDATNLVPGDTNGRTTDVFVYEMQTGVITLVSVASDGTQGIGSSNNSAISVDGNYIVFESNAFNLVAEDTNEALDVFVHERQTGITRRVSVNSSGEQAAAVPCGPICYSFPLSISADGQYVTFTSYAPNLVPEDANSGPDVFVHRLNIPFPPIAVGTEPVVHHHTGPVSAGDTALVSVDSNGIQANGNSSESSISADGRYVVFQSVAANLVPGDTNAKGDVFRYDLQTGEMVRASVDSNGTQANGDSGSPAISADGRYVVFTSNANDLVPGDTNEYSDVFIHDMQTGLTTRVSVDSTGAQANGSSPHPSISADGRYIAFASDATNLVPGDANKSHDIFVHDMQTGMTTCVSVDSNGIQANKGSGAPMISADGHYVAFLSSATNLVPDDTNEFPDIFLHDMQTGVTTRVSVDSNGMQADGRSYSVSVSADGRFIAFDSGATNLVPDDTNARADAFLRDLQTGVTMRVSVDSNGLQGNNDSGRPSISADGRYIAFTSNATNLVLEDANNNTDVFVHDRQTSITTLVSVNSDGAQSVTEVEGYVPPAFLIGSDYPSISADGQYVTFTSFATNLVPGDTNSALDIFVHRQAILPVVTETDTPLAIPTDVPTAASLESATDIPTDLPTLAPTELPTDVPTDLPTVAPTEPPTEPPTEAPISAAN